MRKQWRGCKKSKTLVTLLFRSGGEFRKLLRNTPGVENESLVCSSPLFLDALGSSVGGSQYTAVFM